MGSVIRAYLDASHFLDRYEMAVDLGEARTQTLAGARRTTEADIVAQLQYLKGNRKERLKDCQTGASTAAIVPQNRVDRKEWIVFCWRDPSADFLS